MNQSDLQQGTPGKPTKNRLLTFNQTFASSLIQKPQRFLLDKTLVQGIKQNDSSKIVQNGQQADLGVANQIYDEQKQIQGVFVNTRKKYDHTKETTNKIQNNIDKLKKQKEMLETQINKMNQAVTGEEQEFKNIQIQLEKLNQMCEAAQYAKDIRLQMSDFLKKDILYYKKNCFQANSRIVRNHNKIKGLSNQFQSTKKVSTNCRSLIYSIQKKISDKYTQRNQKISSYHQIINKKMQNNFKREQRQKMIQNSMIQALNGKMPQQQQQRKLLLVNLCLKKMLKLKMQRQMEKYNYIETTFRKIKQHTTVKRAEEFIERFINREKNYGDLLDGISKNQDKINKLKQEKQILEKDFHDFMYQKQQIQDMENQKKGQFNQQNNSKIDILRERLIVNQGLKNKCYSWAMKFISKFDQKNIDSIKEKYPRENIKLYLKQSLVRINKFLDAFNNQKAEQKKVQDEKLRQIYIESKNLQIPQKLKMKNTRIRTITDRDENYNSAFDDHDVAYDDVSEKEYFNQNRKAIKKSNYLRNRIKTKAY